jgi:hypothetical protein
MWLGDPDGSAMARRNLRAVLGNGTDSRPFPGMGMRGWTPLPRAGLGERN